MDKMDCQIVHLNGYMKSHTHEHSGYHTHCDDPYLALSSEATSYPNEPHEHKAYLGWCLFHKQPGKTCTEQAAKERSLREQRVNRDECICSMCNRDINSPLFDGCMQVKCPHGFEPRL